MTNYAVEVSTSSVQIASENPIRTSIAIFNNGTQLCYISQDQVNILSEGIPLQPGQSIAYLGTKDTDVGDAIFAQTATSSTELRISEKFTGESVVVTSAPPTIAGSQNEYQQLEAESKSGALILLTGSLGATGIVISYTPASGLHFTEYSAIMQSTSTVNYAQAQIRNVTIVRDTITALPNQSRFLFNVKGDNLLGDGTKTYDVNAISWTDGLIYASIEGIIE